MPCEVVVYVLVDIFLRVDLYSTKRWGLVAGDKLQQHAQTPLCLGQRHLCATFCRLCRAEKGETGFQETRNAPQSEGKNVWPCFANEAGERWKDFLCKKK